MSTKLAGKGKDALELPVLVILLAGVIECSWSVGTAPGTGSGEVGGGWIVEAGVRAFPSVRLRRREVGRVVVIEGDRTG